MKMTDEHTGVNNEAVAAAEDVSTEIVNGEGENTQVASEDKQPVPYDRFKQVNDEKNAAQEAQRAAEAQSQSLQAQFELMNRSKQPEKQTAASFFKEHYGLESYEQPTVEQIEAHTAHVANQYAMRAQQTDIAHKTQSFIASKPDFADTVGSYTPAGFVPSAQFQKAMVADPSLREDYMSGAVTVQSAYRAVKAHEATTELAAMKLTAKEQKAQQNAVLKTGPLSPTAVGGDGTLNNSINAGLDPKTSDGRDGILANFNRMLAGDYD
jgi:hypothetical protein